MVIFSWDLAGLIFDLERTTRTLDSWFLRIKKALTKCKGFWLFPNSHSVPSYSNLNRIYDSPLQEYRKPEHIRSVYSLLSELFLCSSTCVLRTRTSHSSTDHPAKRALHRECLVRLQRGHRRH